MNKDNIKKVLASNPVARPSYFRRPHWTRRNFFKLMGAGVTASFLAKEADAQSAGTCTNQGMTTINKATNVIFILMAGAPSHVDTFDFKNTPGVTPAAAAPQTVNGILWPTGILPNLGAITNQFSLVRSVQAHALVHSLGQTWVQIGRNPAASLGNIAPNIGSIVALEKASQRQPGHVLPTFLALNSDGAVSSGYLDATYAPFKVDPTTAGLPNTTNAFGQSRWQEAYTQMHAEDDVLRVNSPLGTPVEDMDNLYTSGQGLMYDPTVQSVFTYSAADSTRYGASSFGNALIVAKQALAAGQGTRFVQVTLGGWDMHVDIYGAAQNKNKTNIFTLGKQFDAARGRLNRRPAERRHAGFHPDRRAWRIRPHSRLHVSPGPRSLSEPVRLLRRRRSPGRPCDRRHRRHWSQHHGLRLVPKPRRESRRHRSHYLLGDGNRLDQYLLQRPIP